MRSLVLFHCILLGIGGGACETISIRAVHDVYEADREFNGKNLYFQFGGEVYEEVDFDREVESSRWGIELAYPVSPKSECFVDVSHVRAEFFETRYGEQFQEEDLRDWSVDGEEVGIGIRSLASNVPGWGLDWGVRFKYQDMDDTRARITGAFTSTYDMEVSSYGIDLNIGPHYAIPLENESFLSPHGGLLVRVERGYLKIRGVEGGLPPAEFLDLDYDHESAALYYGFELKSVNLMGLSILANGYLGSENMQGYFLSLGCRF